MPHVLFALVLLALTLAAAEIGFRLARKGATETGAEAGLSAAQSGILILASLLLAFTFGFAGSRTTSAGS